MTEWLNVVLIRAASVTRWSSAHNLAPLPQPSLLQAVLSSGIFLLKEDAMKCRRSQRLLLQYTDYINRV
jgi:hypothetical protein